MRIKRLIAEAVGGWFLLFGFAMLGAYLDSGHIFLLFVVLIPVWVGRVVWLIRVHPLIGTPMGSLLGIVLGFPSAFLGGAFIGIIAGAIAGCIASSIRVGWAVPAECADSESSESEPGW